MNSVLQLADGATSPLEPGTIYRNLALPEMPRLIGALDREPHSRTLGCFDRDYWAWKFRDFPLSMLQAATCPLALLWRDSAAGPTWHHNPRVLEWIVASIDYTVQRQHSNGAFDSVAPNTQDHGVTLALAFYLSEAARSLGAALPASVAARLASSVRKACAFAGRSAEDYAFISNHHALFALAYLNGAELLGDASLRTRAENVIKSIVAHQSADGWYEEYGGPDPGYESLGIFYLAQYWARTGSVEVLQSLTRSVDFYAHCVHPDGSVGGVYGSRATSLYAPAGFEILASRIPKAGAVARFLLQRIPRGNVLTPAASDAENLTPMLHAYLEAARSAHALASVPRLPCEELMGTRQFAASAITVAGAQHYYAVANLGMGGVCRVFDRRSETVAYEDAGYLVCAKGMRWVSQGKGSATEGGTDGGNKVACVSRLTEARQELVTPVRFLMLRILSLTAFRSLKLGAWIRRLIVGRLITTRRQGPFRLERWIVFGREGIRFGDRLQADHRGPIENVFLPRSLTSKHMGSAKYFHESELEVVPAADVSVMARELERLGEATTEFELRFRPTGG